MGNIEIILGGRAGAGDTGEKVVEQFGAAVAATAAQALENLHFSSAGRGARRGQRSKHSPIIAPPNSETCTHLPERAAAVAERWDRDILDRELGSKGPSRCLN
jgi:hypothetical protein